MVFDLFIAISALLSITFFAVWALRGVGGPVEARVRALGLGSSLAERREGDALPFQARVVAPLIESITASTALPASLLLRSEASATALIRSVLFILANPLCNGHTVFIHSTGKRICDPVLLPTSLSSSVSARQGPS